ncbi:MAG: hypothetical protein ACK5O7_03455 [Holosporales bacterium]
MRFNRRLTTCLAFSCLALWADKGCTSLLFRTDELSAMTQNKTSTQLPQDQLRVKLDALYYTPKGPRIWVNGVLLDDHPIPGLVVVGTSGERVTFRWHDHHFHLKPGEVHELKREDASSKPAQAE